MLPHPTVPSAQLDNTAEVATSFPSFLAVAEAAGLNVQTGDDGR